ncbi:MAG TPA: four helix bundle protein [Bacteroidales bacterium]|jgi:four helix bundle protein|nr:four helix bundle protein [Bacteroidales bacterium]MDD4087342.1 four helix bundle protein [Bacteroidales bacterium]MDY0085447.1 four helix bundle protein [Bacteroidales bacterium]HPE44021.1 four helix bundle protein [Bacteroidales bacterium]
MNHQNQTTPAFFRFEDLRIYHKALDYILWVKDHLAGHEAFDSSGIANAFNEAARQIALNIAEGSARNKAQFIYHLKISKSAIRTCVVYGTLALKENMIDEQAEFESRNQLMEMTKMLGALITSLQKNQSQNDENEDDSYPQKNW